jgi:hypothetical protein
MRKYFIDELEKIGFRGKYKWFENSDILGEYLYNKLNNVKERYIILFK